MDRSAPASGTPESVQEAAEAARKAEEARRKAEADLRRHGQAGAAVTTQRGGGR